MSGLNYDVVECVLKELVKFNSATTTWGTVSQVTEHVLHDHAEYYNAPVNFNTLPVKLQRRLVQQSMSFCFDWKYRMLRCVSKKFYHISFMDDSDEDWHWAYMLKNHDPYIPVPSPSREWSESSQQSYVWSPVSHSDSSSEGSDDVDLLALCHAKREKANL